VLPAFWRNIYPLGGGRVCPWNICNTPTFTCYQH